MRNSEILFFLLKEEALNSTEPHYDGACRASGCIYCSANYSPENSANSRLDAAVSEGAQASDHRFLCLDGGTVIWWAFTAHKSLILKVLGNVLPHISVCVWSCMWVRWASTWLQAGALVSLQGSYELNPMHWSERSTFVCLWGVWSFGGGVNGRSHSSPRSASGQFLAPSRAYIPTFSPSALATGWHDWESLRPKLLLSELINIQWRDGVSAQGLSVKSCLPHLILFQTPHLSLFSVPRSLTCLPARSLAHSHTFSHTHQLSLSSVLLRHRVSHAILESWDLLWHTALAWFISYGKWEWENALTPQPDPSALPAETEPRPCFLMAQSFKWSSHHTAEWEVCILTLTYMWAQSPEVPGHLGGVHAASISSSLCRLLLWFHCCSRHSSHSHIAITLIITWVMMKDISG